MSRAERLRAEAATCRRYAEHVRHVAGQADLVGGALTAFDRALELDRLALELEESAKTQEAREKAGPLRSWLRRRL